MSSAVCTSIACEQSLRGPPIWRYMHNACASVREHMSKKERTAFVNSLQARGKEVPCQVCAQHWNQVFQMMHDEFVSMCTSRASTFQMMYDVHNLWNFCLDKQFMPWPEALALHGMPDDTPYQPTSFMYILNRHVESSIPTQGHPIK